MIEEALINLDSVEIRETRNKVVNSFSRNQVTLYSLINLRSSAKVSCGVFIHIGLIHIWGSITFKL